MKADAAGNTLEIHSYNVKSLRLYLRRELMPKPGDLRIVWNGKTVSSGAVREACSLPVPPSGDLSLDLADIRDIKLP